MAKKHESQIRHSILLVGVQSAPPTVNSLPVDVWLLAEESIRLTRPATTGPVPVEP